MGIANIKIENFRSIKRLFIDFNKINIFIGENGAGKSNIISAIDYYYKNLIANYEDDSIFDINNKFSNCVKISITFDLSKIIKICKNHINLDNSKYTAYYQRMLNDNRLSYNSNGINVFNYTNILIEILNIMAEKKLKEPIIIMDEPELSLHNNFMDKMIDRIFYVSNNIYFLIATHLKPHHALLIIYVGIGLFLYHLLIMLTPQKDNEQFL